jgi:hypothetical protein
VGQDVRRTINGMGKEEDVVLVAHKDMNHDHELLPKTMLV